MGNGYCCVSQPLNSVYSMSRFLIIIGEDMGWRDILNTCWSHSEINIPGRGRDGGGEGRTAEVRREGRGGLG